MTAAKSAPTAAGPAARVAEGERQAEQYLARLRARQAGVDELPIAVAALYGPALRGFCQAIEAALKGPRDAAPAEPRG